VTMDKTTHGAWYARAELYDVAFDFRDVPREVDALLAMARSWGRAPERALELACGPGRHVRELARRGLRACGLDLSREMLQFARAEADRESVRADFIAGDMVEFELPEPVDLAMCLMDSGSYLITNDQILSHLRSVARALRPGGLYVMELAHPSNHFGTVLTTQNAWTMTRGDLTVETTFGQPDDRVDPVAEVVHVTVRMRATRGDRTEEVLETAPQRMITCQALRALIELAGVLEPVAWLGAIDPAVSMQDPKAWRMVPVLRKPGGTSAVPPGPTIV
jgi:SAM-dependent methyltransferase